MPAVWGQKYLDKLGLESWEQLEWLAKRALEEKDREREAGQESRPAGKVTDHDEEERHPRTRPRRQTIVKTKVRKTACNETQNEHQTGAPANKDSHDGMSEARSVDDSADADDVESSDRDKSESTGPEVSQATGSGDTTSSDDSGTTHQEADLKKDVDVDMDEVKLAMEALVVQRPQELPFGFAP
ncbi:hypothetical protein CEP53_010397 [Fusarium sp. AF-6]|nr:hypothetical protein CEP53_010397 [Fusarium sp. AF-6]